MRIISVIYPSLTLRRAFWVFDLGVAVVCALYMGQVLISFLLPAPAVELVANNPSADTQILLPPPPPVQTEHLAKSGIFGEKSFAQHQVKPEPPPPPPPSDVLTESELNLKLIATVCDPDPSRSSAIIENIKLRMGQVVYNVGAEISPEVFLKEIRWRRVILDERGKRTYLEWEPEKEERPTRPASAPPRPASKPQPAPVPRTIEISREEILSRGEELLALRDSVSIEPYEENGRVVGLQVSNLGDNPLAKEMGLQDGDVIQTINGVRVSDVTSASDALEKFSSASMIRIALTRGGRRTFVTYKMR